MFYPRNIKPDLLEAAKDTPVLLLNWARQTGKSTLLKDLQHDFKDTFQLIALDDLTVLNSVRSSPQSFLAGLNARHIIIDEILRTGAVFANKRNC
jgi:predicted AAA+ superfamily ATPase